MINTRELTHSKVAGLLMNIQGFYYVITGIWPLLHIESFLAVTGPKEDVWLVRTFGVLIIAVGVGFLVSGIGKLISWPAVVIAVCSALGLMIMDVYYVFTDVIWPTYLLDALAESILLLCWILVISNVFDRKNK